jgi:hypothetical protein
MSPLNRAPLPPSPPRSAAWQLPFVPERLTPLRFTPAWAALRPSERLHYNQLQGLYFHEQIIYFEQAIIVPMLRAARPLVADPKLRDSLVTFEAEENTHSAGFHDLLRTLRPEWYAHTWRHFVQVGPVGDAVLAGLLRHPRQFPFLIWLVQLLEERTMYASRLYLAEADAFPAAIVAAQRQHLVDEANHVQWDIALINQLWPTTPGWLRRLNVRLLDWMVGEFIAVPRRAALRVIDALAADLPDLSVPAATLKTQLRTLAASEQFRARVFGRDAVPRTWKQASTAADLGPFVNRWLSHDHTA